MQRSLGVRIAPPRDRNKIRKDVFRLRRQLGIDPRTYINIVKLLELVLPIIDPLFHLVPVDDKELPGRYAETRPTEHAIYVKQSVYLAAERGVGWARMILAHELGHYFYHGPADVVYAHVDRNERIDPTIDPERQADVFAAEFLAPSGELKGMTPKQIENAYGISITAAKNQLQQANNLVRRHAKKQKSGQAKSRTADRSNHLLWSRRLRDRSAVDM